MIWLFLGATRAKPTAACFNADNLWTGWKKWARSAGSAPTFQSGRLREEGTRNRAP